MLTIMWLRKLRKNKRGVSTVIVVVLSLVILVVVVANVVLWSYKLNQYDLDRMHEDLGLNVTSRSIWLVAQSEYRINNGSRADSIKSASLPGRRPLSCSR